MSTYLTFKLAGKEIPAPVDWQDIQVEATFINLSEAGAVQSVQPNLDIERFVFVNQAAKQIRDYITNGILLGDAGIFEGIPFSITATDKNNTTVVFDGMLDLTDDYEQIHTAKVEAKIKDVAGLNSLSERAQAVSYGFLLSQGTITPSDFIDIKYVAERKVQAIELLMASVTLFLMLKELAEAIRDLEDTIAQVIADTAGGATGPIAGIGYSIAKAIIQAAYVALIIIAIINLLTDMINLLIPFVRTHKGINFRVMLQKAASYLGFNLISPIAELDLVNYLPSKPDDQDPLKEGIPRPEDFGYIVSEAFELAQRCFNAKLQIDGDDLHLRSLNDPFWKKTSTYKMPSVLVENRRFNTGEMRASRIIQFETDVRDEWTDNEFKGTNFAISTHPIIVNNDKMLLLKGLDQVQIPVALGSRKDGLNDVEKALAIAAGAADDVIGFFGGSSNLRDKITTKIGMLKVSHSIHSVPKLVPLVNGRIPSNHRNRWSAKVLYDNYHNEKSFVANNFGNQYELFKDVTVPFGLSEFLQLIKNSFFTTFDGKEGKVDSIKWAIGSDKATMDYRVRETYTKNLIETFVEPE